MQQKKVTKKREFQYESVLSVVLEFRETLLICRQIRLSVVEGCHFLPHTHKRNKQKVHTHIRLNVFDAHRRTLGHSPIVRTFCIPYTQYAEQQKTPIRSSDPPTLFKLKPLQRKCSIITKM